MSSYGYMPYYKPIASRNTSGAGRNGLASAAAGRDPYGLAPNNRSGPLGIGSSSGFAAPARAATPRPAPAASPAATDPRIDAWLAANPYATGRSSPAAPATAASVNHYDVNTDPALQQIQSLVGMSNEQAKSGALKQRQNLLLAYGDPGVAKAVLGADDPIAAAAAQNPTSTVAQLGQSRDRNLKQLTEALNQQNLGYSGYRVTQEQQAGQDYTNALAQAAAGLNSNLGTVDSDLASVLAANDQTLAAGINSAADRHKGDTTDPGAGGDGSGGPSADPLAAPPDMLAAVLAGAPWQRKLRPFG